MMEGPGNLKKATFRALFAAAAGTAVRGAVVRPFATTTRPRIAAAPSAFVCAFSPAGSVRRRPAEGVTMADKEPGSHSCEGEGTEPKPNDFRAELKNG